MLLSHLHSYACSEDEKKVYVLCSMAQQVENCAPCLHNLLIFSFQDPNWKLSVNRDVPCLNVLKNSRQEAALTALVCGGPV